MSVDHFAPTDLQCELLKGHWRIKVGGAAIRKALEKQTLVFCPDWMSWENTSGLHHCKISPKYFSPQLCLSECREDRSGPPSVSELCPECETHNLPSGGSSYLKEAHLCFPKCIFRSTSHTLQLTWHIPKISLLPLSMHGDTTYYYSQH